MLCSSGGYGAEIPEMLYQAVAVVLAYIYRVDRGENLGSQTLNCQKICALMNLVGSRQWVQEGMMRKHQSVGEMISTCCFVGVSSICLLIASTCWSSKPCVGMRAVGINVLCAWRFKICNCQFR